MSDNEDNQTRLRLGLDIVAVILSVSALLVALQSNRLASQDYKAKVVALSVTQQGTAWGSHELDKDAGGNDVECDYEITLANLGGVTASIIEFTPKAYFRGTSANLTGRRTPVNEPSLLTPKIIGVDALLMSTQDYQRHVSSVVSTLEASGFAVTPLPYVSPYRLDRDREDNLELSLPAVINDKDVISLHAEVWFKLANDINPGDTVVYRQPGNSPVEVEFEFSLASGEIVKTSRIPCLYLP